MQSENFDKKIKDSLSQRPPGNDNPDWDKMETLLDKHMPVEKDDRRRIFFILFSFLLLGGGAFLVWQNNNGNKHEVASTSSQKQNSSSIENNKPANSGTDNGTNTLHTDITVADIATGKQNHTDASITIADNNKKINTSVNAGTGSSKQKKSDQTIDELVKNTEPERSLIEDLTKKETEPTITEKKEPIKESEVEKTKVNEKVEGQKEETIKASSVAVNKTDSKKQNTSSFASNFFVSVSAGPDLSKVGDNTGEVKMAYGAGIGYQISKRFSVRTGFYAGRKVYTADPADYHPPDNFWGYYPNLENIEANCKVYDIPITVDYKISSNNKQSWFASVGLSSLLMKEETYDYYYKPNNSPYTTTTRTITNQNKHYFSVLNLSGGYTRVLNKNVSLQAEPYLKIAMSGIGYGKVNLNSGGVLFSAIIKPFAKK
jgi:cytoskeletal protein RodZ